MVVDRMVGHSRGARVLGVMKSMIEHEKAGMGFFARVQFEILIVIAYCSETIMYKTLYVDKNLIRR